MQAETGPDRRRSLLRALRGAARRCGPASWSAEGAIGEVRAHHRPRAAPAAASRPGRPGSSSAPQYGGILTDIASHQVEQFLFFTGADDAEVARRRASPTAPTPTSPGCRTSATCTSRRRRATGMIRVDWFTPDGLPTWGDGRLIIVGTDGHDRAAQVHRRRRPRRRRPPVPRRQGRACGTSTATGTELPFGRQLLADVRDRTETAMPQARCFKAMEIALTAQMLAEESGQWRAA